MNQCEDAMETAGRSDDCDQRFTDAACEKKISLRKRTRQSISAGITNKTHSKRWYEGSPL